MESKKVILSRRVYLIFTGLILLSVITIFDLFAGDVSIKSINFRSAFYLEDERSVDIVFQNDEAYDVTDLELNIKISYKVDPSTWNIVYEYDQTGLTVSANSELEVSTSPETWSPDLAGLYKLSISTYSPVDIDPSNNSMDKEFLAGGFYKISLKQFNFKNPFVLDRSTLGAVGFDLPPVETPRFINMMGQKPGTSTTSWLMKNLPILPFPDTHTLYYHFDYSSLGYVDGDIIDNLDIGIKETDVEIDMEFDVFGFLNKKVWNIDYDIPGDNEETDVVVPSILDELGDLPVPLFGDVYSIDYEYIGCEMPNIELDSSKNGITDAYAGDWNACGPAAAANSMQWLENTVEEIPETGTSHREKLEELSSLMERADGQGVTTDQLVKGKLAYIDKYKLPIHVKYQSWWNQADSIPSPNGEFGHYAENKSEIPADQAAPTWEFLKQEVKNGEDVEVLFGWYRKADGSRRGGHWVTVSGVSETNYAKGVYIKEDFSQGDSGRQVHERYLNWEKGERFGRLVGYDLPDYNCFVESVVSESYDPEITFPGDGLFENYAQGGGLVSDFQVMGNTAPLGENAVLMFTLNESFPLQTAIYSSQGVLISSKDYPYVNEGQLQLKIACNDIRAAGIYYLVLSVGKERHQSRLIRY